MNDLVSIIMASYNSSMYIKETINSVKKQTYKNWELIISDDGSNDSTVTVIQQEAKDDERIKILISSKNFGAAVARNRALELTKGRYIAFLDSDDLWKTEKLENQIKFMKERNAWMCFTSYDLINEVGEYKKTISVPEIVDYNDFLRKPITCTHSIMFDLNFIDKNNLFMPEIRRGQDAATWLKVLKTGVIGYGLNISLCSYRRHSGSLSSNKFKALKRTWYLYRHVEKLSFPYSCFCFISYLVNAIKKYI